MLISDFPCYIVTTLSSKLFEFAYKHIFSSIELGQNGYQYNKHALIKLPIASIEADRTLTDTEVYNIYGINQDEIDYIVGL